MTIELVYEKRFSADNLAADYQFRQRLWKYYDCRNENIAAAKSMFGYRIVIDENIWYHNSF